MVLIPRLWFPKDERQKVLWPTTVQLSLHGKLVGGNWSGTGYYGVANDDSICISWAGKDKGRLRCLEVLIDDGVVKKFNADGSLNGSYEKLEMGKAF